MAHQNPLRLTCLSAKDKRIMMTRSILFGFLVIFPGALDAQRLPAERRHALVLQPSLTVALDSANATKGHAVTGLVIGAAVGLVAAYVLFAPGSNACSGSGDYEQNCRWYRAAIVVGSAGLGALIGSLIRTKKET